MQGRRWSGQRWVCGIAALLAWSCTAYIAGRGSTRPVVLNQSLSSAALLLAACFAAVAFTWLTFAKDRTWQRLYLFCRRWLRTRVDGGDDRRFQICLAVALLCQLGFHTRLYLANRQAVEDQADYLRVATEIAQSYGVLAFPYSGLWQASFLEANRHPLYVWLLALRPVFAWGKLLSILFALLLTVACALTARRRFGPNVACWSTVLLATNFALLYQGSLVACESLLALLVFLGWVYLTPRIKSSTHSALPTTWQLCTISGAWLGLAYLTKASAFFVLIAAGLATAVQRGISWHRRLALASALAVGFAATAFPLLVRNVKVFGSPLYSFNNKLLFADDYDQGAYELEDLGFRGNLRRYLQTHDISDISQRVVGGSATQAFVLCRSLGPAPLESGRAVLGAVLLLLAVATCAADRSVANRSLLVCLFIFWLFFGWYTPIATSDRFWCPILGPLIVTASAGLARTVKVMTQRELHPHAALAWLACWTTIGHLWLDIGPLFPAG